MWASQIVNSHEMWILDMQSGIPMKLQYPIFFWRQKPIHVQKIHCCHPFQSGNTKAKFWVCTLHLIPIHKFGKWIILPSCNIISPCYCQNTFSIATTMSLEQSSIVVGLLNPLYFDFIVRRLNENSPNHTTNETNGMLSNFAINLSTTVI